jgi:hypothetical protein
VLLLRLEKPVHMFALLLSMSVLLTSQLSSACYTDTFICTAQKFQRSISCRWVAVDLGGMQGSLNKMAPASRQWRQAADWARELAHLVDTMQTWLARQLSSTSLPFQKVLYPAFPEGALLCLTRRYCALPLQKVLYPAFPEGTLLCLSRRYFIKL